GAEAVAKMKSSAVLINTSRGAVVDEAALIDALRSGRIAGAGLDVLTTEPPSEDNPLLSMRNVVVTPHDASASQEGSARAIEFALANIERVARGETARSLIAA